MTRFVLDCSVVMAWCFEDQADRSTDAALGALSGGSAVVPALWPLEVGNVLAVAERRRVLTGAEVVRFLGLLASLPILVDGPPHIPDLHLLLALAREHRLSAYDAAYLHLAMRERLPLASRDRRLRAAARAVGVQELAIR